MKRRFLSILLAVVMLIAVLPVGVSAAVDYSPYRPVIQKTIDERIYNEGSGLLYDIDGNGIDELIMVYTAYVVDRGYTAPATVCSAYTIANGTTVQLLDKEVLFIQAGGPDGHVAVVEMNGKKHLAITEHIYNAGDTILEKVGTWKMYSLNGSTLTLDTFVEFNISSSFSTGNILSGSSYAYINGEYCSYKTFKNWEASMNELVTIHLFVSEDTMSLDDLYAFVKEPPMCQHAVVTVPGIAATCSTEGLMEGLYCVLCQTFIFPQQVIPPKGHVYSNDTDLYCNICGQMRLMDDTRDPVHMFRMYDPNSGEHFYTGSTVERANLIAAGWNYEGIGFTFPKATGLPVYRLYEPATGEHLYTMDENEKAALMSQGWNYEGIAFNSGYTNEVPQYRLHNPNATRGSYHFTASIEERDTLIAFGWEYQGIGWYSCWK